MSKSKHWPECLGDTIDEIRASLHTLGVKGMPKNQRNCIIARSYKACCPNSWSSLRVSYGRYNDGSFYGILTFNDCQIMDPDCSPILAEFMYRFDNREFPELIIDQIPSKSSVLAKLNNEERMALGY